MEQSIKRYNFLIIDDEPHVLEGMKMMVDWKQLQCDQVYYCESSEEAHIVMRQHHIDLLITDIRLPGQNGLDLVQSIKTHYKDIKTLVMSGYRDFEYVKKAMTLGVDGYIVKPVFEEEVYEAVKPLIEKMNTRDTIKRYSEASTLFIIKKYLVHEYLSKEEEEYALRYYRNNSLCILACWSPRKGFCENLIKEILGHESAEYKGVILYSDAYGTLSLMKEFYSMEGIEILSKNKESLVWEQGEYVKDLSELKKAYKKYRMILPKLCHYLKGHHILARYFEKREDFIKDEKALYKKIKTEILENEGKMLPIYSENLFYVLFCRYGHLDDIKKHMIDLYYQLVMDVQFLLEKENVLEYYRVLPKELSGGTAEDLINFFESRIIEITDISMKDRKKCKKNLICQVEQIMRENLEENITLKELAKKVHLHPAYLGQKLFDYWGESFQRRLNRMRIEKAVELFKNAKGHIAIEESAYRVGYKNYMTFLKYFKLFYDTLPRDYIQKYKN